MIKHKKYNDIISITGEIEIETTRNYNFVWKHAMYIIFFKILNLFLLKIYIFWDRFDVLI